MEMVPQNLKIPTLKTSIFMFKAVQKLIFFNTLAENRCKDKHLAFINKRKRGRDDT